MSVLVVSIDGPDFSGKTTIANLVTELLRSKNKNLIVKRTELPSTLITGSFTDILRNSAEDIPPEVFALAYALDHLYHYRKYIKALAESKYNYLVIQERSLLTTYIYQGVLGNVDFKWLKEINKFDKNIPDLTLILKIGLEEIKKRKPLDRREFDKFEAMDHLEKQVKVYYNLPSGLRKQFNVEYIDANKDAMVVARKCAERIQKEIDKRF